MKILDLMEKPTFWYRKKKTPFFDRKKDLSSDIRHNPYKDLNEINQSELFQPQVTLRPIRQVVYCPLHRVDVPPATCRECPCYSTGSGLVEYTLSEIREMGRTIPCRYQNPKIQLHHYL